MRGFSPRTERSMSEDTRDSNPNLGKSIRSKGEERDYDFSAFSLVFVVAILINGEQTCGRFERIIKECPISVVLRRIKEDFEEFRFIESSDSLPAWDKEATITTLVDIYRKNVKLENEVSGLAIRKEAFAALHSEALMKNCCLVEELDSLKSTLKPMEEKLSKREQHLQLMGQHEIELQRLVEKLQKEYSEVLDKICSIERENERLKQKVVMLSDVAEKDHATWIKEQAAVNHRLANMHLQPTAPSASSNAKELTRLQSQLVSAQKELQTYKRQAAALEKINKDGRREINELKMTVVDLQSEKRRQLAKQEVVRTRGTGEITANVIQEDQEVVQLRKENSNLRKALEILEKAKMEVSDEKMAIYSQLIEYQKKLGIYRHKGKPTAVKLS